MLASRGPDKSLKVATSSGNVGAWTTEGLALGAKGTEDMKMLVLERYH